MGALYPSTTITILPPVLLSSRASANWISISTVARPCWGDNIGTVGL